MAAVWSLFMVRIAWAALAIVQVLAAYHGLVETGAHWLLAILALVMMFAVSLVGAFAMPYFSFVGVREVWGWDLWPSLGLALSGFIMMIVASGLGVTVQALFDRRR